MSLWWFEREDGEGAKRYFIARGNHFVEALFASAEFVGGRVSGTLLLDARAAKKIPATRIGKELTQAEAQAIVKKIGAV